MSNQNLEFQERSEMQIVNSNQNDKIPNRLKYRQPQMYSFGSLETVQAYYSGSYVDGSSGQYFYNG